MANRASKKTPKKPVCGKNIPAEKSGFAQLIRPIGGNETRQRDTKKKMTFLLLWLLHKITQVPLTIKAAKHHIKTPKSILS